MLFRAIGLLFVFSSTSAAPSVPVALLDNFQIRTVSYGGLPPPSLVDKYSCPEVVERTITPTSIHHVTKCSPYSQEDKDKILYEKTAPLSLANALTLVSKINAIIVSEISHSDHGDSSFADDNFSEIYITVDGFEIGIKSLRHSNTLSNSIKDALATVESLPLTM